MKKWILFSVFFCSYLNMYSQDTLKYFINGYPLDSIKTEYVQIVGTSKLLSNKVSIEIDFGQYNSIWKSSDTQIKNSLGKKIDLNSMIDALNFMVYNGYEYVNSYAFNIESQRVYHYLLRKIKIGN